MPLDNSLDIGQPDPVAFKLILRVQPLEHSKELVGLLHVESNAIVPHKDDDCTFLHLGANLDFRRRAIAAEFDGVGEQVHNCNT